MELFDLMAKISLDDSEYNKGIANATKSGSTFGSKLKTIGKGAGIALAAVGTAAIAMGGAIVSGAKDVAAYGDNVDKMSQKVGMSAEGFQKWDFVLSQNGASIENLQTGMKTLNTVFDDAKSGSAEAQEKFTRLGLSMDELEGKSQEEIFEASIAGLQGMTNESERAAAASDLFGRSSVDMAALLNQSAESTEELKQQAIDYGLVMSDEAIAATTAFTDSMDLLERTFGGLKNKMMGEFLPSLTLVTDGLSKLFTGDMSGLDDINAGIDGFVGKITEMMPKILEIGGSILSSLAGAILNNLPELISAASETILTLADGLIQNLPLIIETGLEVIVSLVDGLIEALPELIPAAVEAVLTIVEALIDNIDMLIDAAIEIIMALAEGLIDSLPILIEKAPVIITKLVTAIIQNAPKLVGAALELIAQLTVGLVQGWATILAKVGGWVNDNILQPIKNKISEFVTIGAQIVNGIKQGIAGAWSTVVNFLTGGISNIISSVKNMLGIKSPSRVFRDEVGKQIVLGLALGIKQNQKKAIDAAAVLGEKTLDEAKEWIDEKTFYEELSANDELAIWEELAKRYEEGSDERKEIDKEVYTQKKALIEESEELEEEYIDRVKELEQQYSDAVADRAQEIFKSYGLFDEVAGKERVSGQSLISNLKDQNRSMTEFYDDIAALSEKGISSQLVEDIKGMGVDAQNELDALLRMSDKQLQQYSDLYEEKQKIANEQAIEEMEPLKEEINEELDNLIDEVNDKQTEAASAGYNISSSIADGILSGKSAITSAISKVISAAKAEMSTISGGTSSEVSTSPIDTQTGSNSATADVVNAVLGAASWSAAQNINLNVDGKTVASAMVDPLLKLSKAKGVSLA